MRYVTFTVVLLAIGLLSSTIIFAEKLDWNHYESKSIPPHGKYTNWVSTFSEDGKQRIGFVWFGNQISFGTSDDYLSADFVLSSRRDFGEYSVISTFQGVRLAAVGLKHHEHDLSLVFRMSVSGKLQAYLSNVLSCHLDSRMHLFIDEAPVENICEVDSERVRNATKISVLFDKTYYAVPVSGSGASIIWLKDNDINW